MPLDFFAHLLLDGTSAPGSLIRSGQLAPFFPHSKSERPPGGAAIVAYRNRPPPQAL